MNYVKCFADEGGYVSSGGIKPEGTMDLFRCTGISISRIFPWDNWLLTQPTLIRHPWLRQRLFGTSGPEIVVDYWEYQEILIPSQSHKSIVPSGFMPFEIAR